MGPQGEIHKCSDGSVLPWRVEVAATCSPSSSSSAARSPPYRLWTSTADEGTCACCLRLVTHRSVRHQLGPRDRRRRRDSDSIFVVVDGADWEQSVIGAVIERFPVCRRFLRPEGNSRGPYRRIVAILFVERIASPQPVTSGLSTREERRSEGAREKERVIERERERERGTRRTRSVVRGAESDSASVLGWTLRWI